MPEDKKTEDKASKNATYHKFLTAIVFTVVFIICIRFLDTGISFLILTYLPYLENYLIYVSESINVILGVIGCYVVYRVLISILAFAQKRDTHRASSAEVAKTILRVLFYAAVISIILISFGPTFGISLSQALAGGAIGGIVVGFAVQTIAASIISGIFVSSSKTITPGEVVIMHASLWGDLLCRVTSVNVLFTEVVTQNGSKVKVPNTTLLNAATFTRLKTDDTYTYPLPISISSDASASEIDATARKSLGKKLSKMGKRTPKIYLSSKVSGSNTFTVMLKFDHFAEINDMIDVTNKVFDDAYWEIKNKPAGRKVR